MAPNGGDAAPAAPLTDAGALHGGLGLVQRKALLLGELMFCGPHSADAADARASAAGAASLLAGLQVRFEDTQIPRLQPHACSGCLRSAPSIVTCMCPR